MDTRLLTPASRDLKTKTTTAPSLKVITFQIGNLNLAIAITAIYKILKQTPIEGSGINSVGVAHLSDRELTVIDLQRQLFQDSAIKNQGQDNHLIVIKTASEDFYGIPVENVPILMDIPLSTLRVLPESYRRADTLGIASHVAILPQEQGTSTVFLLDINLLAQ
jgi:purine-binding chemotaxis protein CheW